MIALHHLGGHGQRVGFVQDGVGGGNRRIAGHATVDHVAKVEQAGDPLVVGEEVVVAAGQHVVVVGVAVDDGLAQLRQVRRGLHLEAVQVTFHQGAALRVGDFVEVGADDRRCVGQIPVEVAVYGGMVETGQRAVEFCHEATQAGHERG